MRWLPENLDAFSLTAGVASIVSLIVSFLILLLARHVDMEVRRVRASIVAKIRTDELMGDLRRHLTQLAKAISGDNAQAQRDLAKRIAAQLTAIGKHMLPGQASQAETLAKRFLEATAKSDPPIMKARLLDARGDLEAFLVGLGSTLRDRELAGEQ